MEGNKDHAHLSSPLVQLRKVCTTLFTLVKEKKKTKFLFEYHLCYSVTVATTCNGKRNNLAAKEKDSRQKKRLTAEGRTSRQKGKEARQKGKDSRQKKKPHDKRKRLTEKEKTPRLREKTLDKREKPYGKRNNNNNVLMA